MAEKVLITGARAPAALAVARSFAAAGYEAHMADCSPARMARASKAVKAVYAYRSPRGDKQGFRDDLAALVGWLDPTIVVPACEEVFHLAAAASELGLASRVFAPDLATLALMHSKYEFAHRCTALGLASPPTVRVTSRDKIEAITDPSGQVFKREYSRFGVETLVGPTRGQLAAISPSPAEPWVVQTRIAGDEVSFYAVCVSGKITAFSTYRSTWKRPGGAGYAFETLDAPLAGMLFDMAAILASDVGHGQFACDAIVDAAGMPWLIECNPRSTSGTFLFDPPQVLAQAMLRQATVSATPGIRRRLGLALWRYGLPEAVAKGRLADWSASGQDVITQPGDRAPALGAIADTLSFASRARRDGISLEAAMTADIEWNGEPL